MSSRALKVLGLSTCSPPPTSVPECLPTGGPKFSLQLSTHSSQLSPAHSASTLHVMPAPPYSSVPGSSLHFYTFRFTSLVHPTASRFYIGLKAKVHLVPTTIAFYLEARDYTGWNHETSRTSTSTGMISDTGQSCWVNGMVRRIRSRRQTVAGETWHSIQACPRSRRFR